MYRCRVDNGKFSMGLGGGGECRYNEVGGFLLLVVSAIVM